MRYNLDEAIKKIKKLYLVDSASKEYIDYACDHGPGIINTQERKIIELEEENNRRKYRNKDLLSWIDDLCIENDNLKKQLLSTMNMTEEDLENSKIDSGKSIDEVFGESK